MPITNFLNTERSKTELDIALEVLREFKSCEGRDEWLGTPFIAWAKLEQLEEFLAHLAEGAKLKKDTLQYMEYIIKNAVEEANQQIQEK